MFCFIFHPFLFCFFSFLIFFFVSFGLFFFYLLLFLGFFGFVFMCLFWVFFFICLFGSGRSPSFFAGSLPQPETRAPPANRDQLGEAARPRTAPMEIHCKHDPFAAMHSKWLPFNLSERPRRAPRDRRPPPGTIGATCSGGCFPVEKEPMSPRVCVGTDGYINTS